MRADVCMMHDRSHIPFTITAPTHKDTTFHDTIEIKLGLEDMADVCMTTDEKD